MRVNTCAFDELREWNLIDENVALVQDSLHQRDERPHLYEYCVKDNVAVRAESGELMKRSITLYPVRNITDGRFSISWRYVQ